MDAFKTVTKFIIKLSEIKEMLLNDPCADDTVEEQKKRKFYKENLQAISERIVPADEQTPGAMASGAFDYLWAQLGPGGDLETHWPRYVKAIWDVQWICEKELYGTGFDCLNPSEQDRVLTILEGRHPKFFARMVEHVQEGFYISQAAWDMIGWKVTA